MTPTKIFGLLLVIAYVVALRALEILDIQTAFEPVLLLPLLNTLFHGIIPIVVAYVAGRSYLKGGSLTVLLMGCGMLVFGLCAILAGWVIGRPGGPNLTVTIHNTGVFLGALFHATGGVLGLIPGDRAYDARRRKSIIFVTYSGIILFMLFFSYATLGDLIPPFFIQGAGPTDLRQTVLGSSIILYFTSCIFFMTNYFRLKSDFLYWYALCLALICIGLFGIFIQKAVGSPMGWLGRSALYTGGIFALAAVISALKAAKVEGKSLEQSISDSFEHLRGSNVRGSIAALPVPIILILLVILASLDFRSSYDPPGLRASLNTLFLDILPLGAVYFATKGYLQSGLFSMLMLGSGALTLGSGSFVSNWTLGLHGVGSNVTATIFNLALFFSGIFHLFGAATAFVGGHWNADTRHKGLVVVFTFIGVGVLMAMLTFVTLKELVPVFFVQGQGPTPLRQVVLGSAVFLFSISSLLLLSLYLFSKTRMFYWYSLALLLITTGLLCYMANTSIGGPIGWLGRCSLYLSGVYLLVAVISASRELHVRGESPEIGLANLFRHHLESLVEERTLQLSRAKEGLQAAHNDLERANAELSKTNQLLRALMEALPVGVSFSDDTSCQRIAGNPCLYAQFEITAEDNISASAPDLAAPGRLVRFFHNGREVRDIELPLQRAVAENTVIPPIELDVRLPSGRRWVTEASGAPILDEQGAVVGGVAVTVDITERKQAEEALKEHEVRLAHALEAGKFGSWSLNVKTGNAWRTLRHDQIFGYQALLPEWTYEMFLDHVLAEDVKTVDEKFGEALRTRTEWSFECRIQRMDGLVRWIWAQGLPRFDGQGELVEMVGLVQDITDRKRAEEALQKAHDELELRVQERTAELEKTRESIAVERQRLYDILETMPVMVCLLTPDYHVAFANRGFREKFGEDNGRHCYDYCFGRKEPCEFCESYQVLETGKPHYWEVKSPDGSVIAAYDFPFTDTDGSPLILEMDIDITEQRRAQEVVRAERQRLYDVMETLPAYVCMLDSDYRMPFANRYFRESFGESQGRRCHDFLFNLEKPCETCETYTAMKTRAPHRWCWTGPNGRDYDVYDFPFYDTDGSMLILEMGIDITEMKRAQNQRERLIKELEAKNAELERFAYTVSHDLKSPLITIKSFLGFVAEDAANQNAERLKADLDRIDKAAEKMGNLLNEILELSRIGRIFNPVSAISAEDLANEVIELLAGRIARNGVKVQVASDLPILYADRPRALEVFQNLIENATKFMGNQAHPRIEIGSRQNGDETVLFVRDNGIGIDPLYQEKVFGLFDKLDQQTEGTGIGLALVKRIVEVHGGRIWVESDGLGKGSTFCFTLPPPDPDKRE